MTRRPPQRPTPAEAEALLSAPKDAHLASPKWDINQDPNGQVLTAHLGLDVTAEQLTLTMAAHWTGPETQQVRLQVPGTNWNLCRLCLCRLHDDVHWHCLDRYDIGHRRTSPADIKRGPYAIHQMLDHFVEALNINGFTTPLDTWS